MHEVLGVNYYGFVVECDTYLSDKEKKRIRYELVEKSFLDKGIEINDWYRIRTNPYNDDYVFVKAETRDEALRKYIERSNK